MSSIGDTLSELPRGTNKFKNTPSTSATFWQKIIAMHGSFSPLCAKYAAF